MSKTPYKVYVIQGRGQRDYADCEAALAHVPALVETLTFIGDAAEVIERTRDADALIVTASPITRRVMEALEGLKVRPALGGQTRRSPWDFRIDSVP